MFNGIIFNQGKVKKISKRKKGINIFVYSKLKISKKDIGMSISCDGVCLTYYYNQDSNECEEFIFGCCGPEAFDTMQNCIDTCE